MSFNDKIAAMSDQKFQGLTNAELREAGAILGVKFGPNTSESTMREKLCEKVGQLPTEGVAMRAPEPLAPVLPIGNRSPFQPKPALRPTDTVWGGRMHKLIVSQPSDNVDTPKSHLAIKWESEPRWWSYDKEIHMAEPYYNALMDCMKADVSTQHIFTEGVAMATRETVRSYRRYNVQYLGILEGTEDLPTCLLDYWQRQYMRTNGFRDPSVTRQHLMSIRSELVGPPDTGARAFYKDLTNEDILADIYEFLGPAFSGYAEAA